MPVENYSVLRGTPVAGRVAQGHSPHYQITIHAAGQTFTIAVNIESTDGSAVLYRIQQNFEPPDPAALTDLSPGITPLQSRPGGLALDYVREEINGAPMVQRSQMTLLPLPGSKPGSSLSDAVISLIQQAIAGGGEIYAFGSAYADSGVVDGIHNIHMNQGNPAGAFERDNGIWQDGGLFVQPSPTNASPWTAVFIAFQSEVWQTTGNGDPV